MKISLNKLGFALALALTGCATTPKPTAAPAPVVSSPSAEEIENIDLEGLERSLKLSRPQEELGYQEASFNTCSAGYGFSSSRNCRKMVLAVVHVRLQCRDSEGTISTALGAADLVAIAGQSLRWTLQKHDGVTTTDGEGYATVRGLFPRTPKNDWLRLAVGIQFLNMRANQVTRVVTPRPWCHAD